MQISILRGHAIALGLCSIVTAFAANALAAADTFPQPSATPEDVKPETGDFPYLPPLPGSVLTKSETRAGGYWFGEYNSNEDQLIAKTAINKAYKSPGATAIDPYTFYLIALTKGRWDIRDHGPAGGGRGIIETRYALNGRNIWAFLYFDTTAYDLQVGDATLTEAKLDADLAAQCRAVLGGVIFEFNTPKLRPESDAVLEPVAAMMMRQPSLKLQVEGHTNTIGPQDFWLPLVKARAQAVAAWLTDHGVAAGRLDLQASGEMRTIAANEGDVGRARNQIEISNRACKPAAP